MSVWSSVCVGSFTGIVDTAFHFLLLPFFCCHFHSCNESFLSENTTHFATQRKFLYCLEWVPLSDYTDSMAFKLSGRVILARGSLLFPPTKLMRFQPDGAIRDKSLLGQRLVHVQLAHPAHGMARLCAAQRNATSSLSDSPYGWTHGLHAKRLLSAPTVGGTQLCWASGPENPLPSDSSD